MQFTERLRIWSRGTAIRVELNGSVILAMDISTGIKYMADNPHREEDRPSGAFGFAGHGDAVEFRNVRIKRI